MPTSASQSKCIVYLLAMRPDWTVLTAAYTDVDGSEGNPENAFAVCASEYRECGSCSERGWLPAYFSCVRTIFRWNFHAALRARRSDRTAQPIRAIPRRQAKRRSANTIETECIARTSGFLAPLVLGFPEEMLACLRGTAGTHRCR